jgi:hypothetical protein
MRRVAIALVHYPVLDRGGETVTTAITNLDLHDMARSARTYGIDRLFVVHPVEAQRSLAERIREHWVSGSGKKRIPDRATALDVLAIVPSMADVFLAMDPSVGRRGIELWTTAASAVSFGEARRALEVDGPPVLIAFGTGWGLARELVDDADARLEPIHARAETGFNHLSVRAACAITLDRLLG